MAAEPETRTFTSRTVRREDRAETPWEIVLIFSEADAEGPWGGKVSARMLVASYLTCGWATLRFLRRMEP